MNQDRAFFKELYYFATAHPVWSNLTVAVLIALVQLLLENPITIALNSLGIAEPSDTLVLLLCIFAAALIVISVYWLVEFKAASGVAIKSYNSGLVRIFPNFHSTKPMLDEIANRNSERNISEVSILVHSASNLICGNGSVLHDFMISLARQSPFIQPEKVNFLIPSLSSPYYIDRSYLEERAIERGREIADPRWSKDEYIDRLVQNFELGIQNMHSSIKEFHSYGLSRIEIREHVEPYLFNLIIIDEKVFVQGDIFKKSLWKAPVMLFAQENESNKSSSPLSSKTYSYTFKKYFEDIWKYKSQPLSIL